MEISFRLTPRILKDTQRLVRLYNTNLGFREQFDALLTRPNVTFQGQPLTLYAWVISKISPHYYPQAKEVWESQEKIKDLLVEYYHNRRELKNLEIRITELGKIVAPGQEKIAVPDEGIMATAEQIEKTPEGDPQKVKFIEQIREEIKEDLKTPEATQSQPQEKEPEHTQTTAKEPKIIPAATQDQVTVPTIPEKPAPETLPKEEPAKRSFFL